MGFLNEKQSRRYCIFLAFFCGLLLGFVLLSVQLHAQGTKSVLQKKEQTIASALLLQGVSEGAAAAAFGNEEITAEGVRFLEKIGRSQRSDPWLLSAIRENASAFLIFGMSGGCMLCALLLAGSVLFLNRREKLYQEAAEILARFAEGDFSRHLSRDREGTLYQMFDAADQLSMALQAKGEAALLAKEALQDAVSDISHQLKTPLAALAMYAEIILDEPDNPQTVQKFARKAQQSLTRMETLIQTLLKVMRLDAGSVMFEKRACRAAELVGKATGELYTRANREEKHILTEGDPDELFTCDPTWTAEAISNLVKNALDHTAAGGTVRIGWQRSPAMLRLWVADDGCGIDAEDMPHIFKRFYRSRKSSDMQGAGLGLSLVKSIVEGQGGTVSAVSTAGEGTVFTLSFW